jgi:H+/Cl- antiporter ClcA
LLPKPEKYATFALMGIIAGFVGAFTMGLVGAFLRDSTIIAATPLVVFIISLLIFIGGFLWESFKRG